MEEKGRTFALMQQREDFITTLTHDLKNPLIGANRIIEVMLGGDLGPLTPEHDHLICKIRDSNLEILSLIRNLLDTYRHEKDLDTLLLEETDIQQLVHACVDEASLMAVDNGIELDCTMDTDDKSVLLDRSSIKRVLQNLLNNAIKFTPCGGKVMVELHRESDNVRLSVENSGSSISAEEQPWLFQRFWQGAMSKDGNTGNGLGLYLCKRIVDAHKGNIECQSSELSGTRFTVTLPCNN